jgi:hypothetical protein
MESAPDLCRCHRLRREGARFRIAGLRYHVILGPQWSAVDDARCRRAANLAGSGDNATAVGLYSAVVTALYRRERTGKGSYVTTSLLAEGVWSASVSIQAALL